MATITKNSKDWLTDDDLRAKLHMCRAKFYRIMKEGQKERNDDFRMIFCRMVGGRRLWSLASYEKWCLGEL